MKAKIDPPPPEEKLKFLESVYLTKGEYQKLVDRFGKDNIKILIENLNNYMLSKGVKYKSHYHTILNWARRDQMEGKEMNNGWQCIGCGIYGRGKFKGKCPNCETGAFKEGRLPKNWEQRNKAIYNDTKWANNKKAQDVKIILNKDEQY